MKSTHKYREIQIKMQTLVNTRTRKTRSDILYFPVHRFCDPFPPLWKEPIPSPCARADVRWLEGLCSLTVGTDHQKRDTTYKGQISIRIRCGSVRNIGKSGLSGNLETQEKGKLIFIFRNMGALKPILGFTDTNSWFYQNFFLQKKKRFCFFCLLMLYKGVECFASFRKFSPPSQVPIVNLRKLFSLWMDFSLL